MTTLRRNSEIIAAGLGDETILLDATTWTYVHLNETATRIWEEIGEMRSVSDVVSRLTSEYDVDERDCRSAVQEFAEEMSRRGFVVIGEE